MALYLTGSGPDERLSEVYEKFISDVKTRGTKILLGLTFGRRNSRAQAKIVSQISEIIGSRWPESEIQDFDLSTISSPAKSTSRKTTTPSAVERFCAQLDEVGGIIIADGKVSDYLAGLTPVRDVLRQAVRSGTSYLGFGAGTRIVSTKSVLGGWKYSGRQICPKQAGAGLEELSVTDGLGLLGPTFITECDISSNLGVGLACLEKDSELTVAGIDAGTCLAVDEVSGRTRVYGSGRVYWLSNSSSVSLIRWQDRNFGRRGSHNHRKGDAA